MRRGALFLLLLLPTGCSSLYDLAGGTRNGPQVYGGMNNMEAPCRAAGFLKSGCPGGEFLVYLLYTLIECPLALAMDTLLLPVTVPITLLRRPAPEKM